ncbi:MAG: hypothetical protein ACUVQ8_01990 [Nitrososphaeria archaeon]
MSKIAARKLSIAVIFSSLYVVLSFIPIGTSIIGGKDSFKLSIVLPPVAGCLLGTQLGVLSMLLGSVIGNFFSVSSPIGPLGLLVPVSGALFSGLNRRGLSLVTASYLILFFSFFFVVYPTIWWFALPHVVSACLAVLIPIFRSSRISVFFNTLSSTFSQHSTGTVLFVLLLSLKPEAFYVIFPLMIYERAVASIGAFLIIVGIEKRIKSYAVK